ncbi:putative trehalase precursor [Purpureocillium lavendulum]|uniref:Trehalase n=1 Tax=Purpureocillium lavendulum TaxID=1247861 RepID=A0AB34G0H2_9HYPO|nr:putative trehalase precursor [Purpureocillium lavendulum]
MDSYERLGSFRSLSVSTSRRDKEVRERRDRLRPQQQQQQSYYPMPSSSYAPLPAGQTSSAWQAGEQKSPGFGYTYPAYSSQPPYDPYAPSYKYSAAESSQREVQPYAPPQEQGGYSYAYPSKYEQPGYQTWTAPKSPRGYRGRADDDDVYADDSTRYTYGAYPPAPNAPYLPPRSPPQQEYGHYYNPYPSTNTQQPAAYGLDGTKTGRRGKGVKQPPPATKEPLTFELNPLEPQDVTIHMSLDATDDLESTLEEFSRLRRLGRFNDAVRHFETRLEHFLDNKYVLTQYGHFLDERVNAKEFAKLARRFPPQPVADSDALQLNWDMLVYLAGLENDIESPVLQDIDKLGDRALDLLQESFPNLDSTEMELLSFVLLAPAASLDDVQERFNPHTFSMLYQHLSSQGLVWELCDLFQALESICGVEAVLLLLIPYSTSDTLTSIKRLATDWDSPDEASMFALVELFTSLALAYMKLPEKREAIDACLGHASKYANRLISVDAANLKTRPCLRYMMAGVIHESYDDSGRRPTPMSLEDDRFGSLFASKQLFPTVGLPFYAPMEDERPLWQPNKTDVSATGKLTTRVVLSAAEDIGDVVLQQACLLEAMMQGEEAPDLVLEKLDALWATLGCGLARQRNLLFRYRLKHTPQSLEELRRDILAQGESGRRSTWQDYAQCMIVRALTPGQRAKQAYKEKAEEIEELLGARDRERQHERGQNATYPTDDAVAVGRAPMPPPPPPLQQPGPVYFNLTVVNPPVELDSAEISGLFGYKAAPRSSTGPPEKQSAGKKKKEVTWKPGARLTTELSSRGSGDGNGNGDVVDDEISANMSAVPDLPLYTPSAHSAWGESD